MNLRNILPFILLFFIAGCNETLQKDSQKVISVSILPQKYIVERITEDNFIINVMVPPGASAETYEPSPRQMKDVANSELYFRIGYLEFETTVIRNIQEQNRDQLFVNTAEGVDLISDEEELHGDHVHQHGVDPHIWLSIPAVKIQIENILEAIIGIDAENKDLYTKNYNQFISELDEMHLSLRGKFDESRGKSFLIFHPALGYFARDYGLNQIPVEVHGKSPTAANIKSIIDTARKENINDIFIQKEFERESAEAVASELGGEVIAIDPLSANWLENMKEISDALYSAMNKKTAFPNE